jgi:hypothetical protein
MTTPGPSISPTLRYRDASGAIEFLQEAFGFEKAMVVPGENGTIAHAELRYGNGMVMLGSAVEDTDYGRIAQRPGSSAAYVVVRRRRGAPRPLEDCGCRDRASARRPGVRLARLRSARPRGQPLELRDLPTNAERLT